jgi:UDP-N-acetylmuramoylalanine--D-glutamate ligase
VNPTANAHTPPGSRTLVLGMGTTGAGCARYLARVGARACFADSRAAPPGLAAIRAALPTAELWTGAIPATVPAGVEQIVVSPGVPLDLPLLAAAATAGLPVVSDLDLFAAVATAPVIGITGSNGKSTVTTMTGHLLTAADAAPAVGGNLGTPALDLLSPAARVYVLELSSFQLERSRPLPLRVATILNITPDHLDLHGDLAAYTRAKARICLAADQRVVNADAPETHGLGRSGVPVLRFGLGPPAGGDFGLVERDGRTWLAEGSRLLLPAADVPMAGRHNLANALAALALVRAAGFDPAAVAPALRSYVPLGHRMAVVPTRDGIRWIDDSKATNTGAAEASIRSLDGRLVLIAGGDAKGATFESLAAALADRTDGVVLIGRDRERIAAALGARCPVLRAGSIEEAVAEARRLAQPGSTVLLAPACSSLDMFRDYAERGTRFRTAVLAADQPPARSGSARR